MYTVRTRKLCNRKMTDFKTQVLALNSPISMGHSNYKVKTDPFHLISDLISVWYNFVLCNNLKYT